MSVAMTRFVELPTPYRVTMWIDGNVMDSLECSAFDSAEEHLIYKVDVDMTKVMSDWWAERGNEVTAHSIVDFRHTFGVYGTLDHSGYLIVDDCR